MFSAILINAFQESHTDFPIRYHFDGNEFNLKRLQTDVLDVDKLTCTESTLSRAVHVEDEVTARIAKA